MLDFENWQKMVALYTDYGLAVDGNEWSLWLEFFTEDCVYKIQPRENYDRGFPLATLAFESKGMLKDRVYGMTETIFHDPYYQRHVIGVPQVISVTDERIESQANYAVFRTKPDGVTTVFNVGRYVDCIRRTPAGLKFESRICVFDSEMIPNSIIYPI
ncbi:salicylate 5-hydroxylase small subunit [Paraburkholderia sp. EB58]|jgi:salicylate 5-hydroxylase small subunit|uniref:aromatic-ring-hydroxylating dioxygenase subunit beta n=1 Tax=Paraburkholderia sp. EB58 TaxID=3035125 RepID=UPI003D221FE0